MPKLTTYLSMCCLLLSLFQAECRALSIDLYPEIFYHSSPDALPLSAEAYTNQGIICCKKGLWKNAVKPFTRAIEINAGYTRAYYYRGIAFYKNMQPEKGLADFCKAIELTPEYADAYYARGIVYKYLKQYDKSVADFNRTLELQPDHKDAKKEKTAVQELIKNARPDGS